MLGRVPRHRRTSLTAEPDARGEGVSPAAVRLSSPGPEMEALGRASEQAVADTVLSSSRWRALPHAARKPTGEGVHLILVWLAEHDGDTWQLRWENANPHDGLDWIDELAARGALGGVDAPGEHSAQLCLPVADQADPSELPVLAEPERPLSTRGHVSRSDRTCSLRQNTTPTDSASARIIAASPWRC